MGDDKLISYLYHNAQHEIFPFQEVICSLSIALCTWVEGRRKGVKEDRRKGGKEGKEGKEEKRERSTCCRLTGETELMREHENRRMRKH